jgi:hypothetical protein
VSGHCSLYVLHEGEALFVARLNGKDSFDWTGSVLGIFAGAFDVPKTAFLGKDGEILLFRSRETLTEYDNEGAAELYRYSATEEHLACVSCSPTGEALAAGASFDSIDYSGALSPPVGSVAVTESRNLSVDGNRVFFETTGALLPEDTNGEVSCPGEGSHSIPACTDVYQWEAPGTGTCSKGGEGYSVLNEGCVYLLSTGKSPFPSFFADASESGSDVFFFTRQGLVAQDTDELQDVYDARVGGGIPSQNQVPPEPCLGAEACHGPVGPAPPKAAPVTPGFIGPGNPAAKHKKQGKAKKHKAKKHKGKKKHKAKKRANSSRGQAGV